jgi:hypothetical protein
LTAQLDVDLGFGHAFGAVEPVGERAPTAGSAVGEVTAGGFDLEVLALRDPKAADAGEDVGGPSRRKC